MPETVWAIHNFEAEAEDEISFHIGEPIVVLQKDELYQDGWWEGTNVRGETGLFPQNYTTQSKRIFLFSDLGPPEQPLPEAPIRDSNTFGNNSNVGVANNNSSSSNHDSNFTTQQYGGGNVSTNANMNHINNHSNPIHGNHNIPNSRMLAQQSQSNYNNGLNNMHIQQNPAIASPSMGSTRGGFGGGPVNSGTTDGTPTSKVIAQSVEESLNDPQLAGHPSGWSIEQVAYWLRWCGFGTVVPSFVENEISGAILLELNLNNLKELDITSFGKRFNIMNAITSLKQHTKSGVGSKGLYGTLSGPPSMYGVGASGPNIPPRMTSAPINVNVNAPSPRASFDSRGDYLRDPRHQDLHDPRSAPLPPGSSQSSNVRQQQQLHSQPQPPTQQQFPEYEMHSSHPQSRAAALARSDTVGSMLSGGSMADYAAPSSNDAGRGGQRQSITSAYSSNSNPLRNNQWDRNVPRAPPPQMPSPAVPQPRGPPSDFDDMGYGPRPVEQQLHQPSMDQYPRAMDVDRKAPMNPEMLHPDPYPESMFEQPTPKPRKYHNPDTTNRPQNGKADPSDKVVSLDMIGKPDYAGWLKKRGDTYRTWKSRWFMLKGVTLYYMNSPKDNASKDYINLIGYKIIQDENIYAGKYCFKAVHEELRNFFFYTDSESDMKGWLKALMKVTIGRDPTAPVISSSNIPTIPLHVARKLAPRPPSPSKRNHALGPNEQPMYPQQHQQQQQQLQYDQKFQQQQQQPTSQFQQKSFQQQLLDYDDQDSDGDDYLPNEYGPPRSNTNNGSSNKNLGGNGNSNAINGHMNGNRIVEQPESPILQGLSGDNKNQQRHSFVHPDQRDGDDDPWRDEDGEGFGAQQRQQQKTLKDLRPDSELDSFRQPMEEEQQPPKSPAPNTRWTQEQYINWVNRHLPSTVDPVSDMAQSLRSGVILVRLIEQLSGEQVDKRIPNATYTLQMLENLLTAFKFMDRVGISTDGYTVKDIFNGNEDKIVLMFDSIRARFPEDAISNLNSNLPAQKQQQPSPATSFSALNVPAAPASLLPPLPSGAAPSTPVISNKGSPRINGGTSPSVSSQGRSPLLGPGSVTFQQQKQQQPQLMQSQHTDGSEYEALYDEAARSTIS
ncbi:polar growth protein [Mortierella claussenii]|nr:polar growth protein [Mortierella claussenii]